MKFGVVVRALGPMVSLLLLAGCEDLRGYKLFQGAEYPAKDGPVATVIRTGEAAEEEAARAAPVADAGVDEPDVTARAIPAPEIYPGTGKFLNEGRLGRGGLREGPVGEITFNFVDTNVREVVRAILGDTLGLNYVIDPNVQGTVTIQTSRPLPRSALIGALENVLRLTDAVLVQEDGLYKVVPAAEGVQSAPPVTAGSRRGRRIQGFGIHIAPVRFVAAAEIAKMLEPVAPPGAIVHTDPARNLIMLSGTKRELQGLLELIEVLDVDWLAGTSFALYPVESAEVKDIVAELKQIFGEDAAAPISGLVRFIPIERINTILAIASREAYLQEAGRWIQRLDRAAETTARRLFVYYVQNGRAVDLASILGEVFQVSEPRRKARAEVAPGLTPVEIESPQIGAGRDEQPERQARAEEGEPARAQRQRQRQQALQQQARQPGAGDVTVPQAGGEIRIIADESNNALVVMATPKEYRQIQAVLKKLDIVPLQVLIEATIAEVALNDALEYGVQWFFKAGSSSFTLGESIGAVGRAAVAQASPGFSYLFDAPDIRVVLNALQSVTDVNVISSPQLMVLDNQTAELQVGDQVPIATQSAVSVDNVTSVETTLVNTVEFRDTGIILRVTPRINAGGLVIMEIEQEVSDVVATLTSGIDSPTIQQRRIHSTVAVQSGETIALGGLIKDSKDVTKSGVPILQDIPIIGALFRNTVNDVDRTELLVLITPHVVSNRNEAREVTDELRRRLRSLVPLGEKIE